MLEGLPRGSSFLLLCGALLFSLCPQSVFAKADITIQNSTGIAAGNPAEQEQMSDEGKDSVLEHSDNSVLTAENSVSGCFLSSTFP